MIRKNNDEWFFLYIFHCFKNVFSDMGNFKNFLFYFGVLRMFFNFSQKLSWKNFMLYRIAPSSQRFFMKELEEYFKLRKSVLVDECGWDLPVESEKEQDSFDHDQAHYLLYKDPQQGQIVGGVRLIPSVDPNLTCDIFPSLIDVKKKFVPSPRIWEGSRLVVKSTEKTFLQETFMTRTMAHLLMGIIDYGLAQEFHKLLVMTDVRLERMSAMVQWPLLRLGNVQKVGNAQAVVGLLEISLKVREKIHRYVKDLI